MMTRDFSADRDFAELIGCFTQAKGSADDFHALAQRRGIRIKAAGIVSDDTGGIGRGIADAFFAAAEHGPGVFDTVRARSRQAALHARTFIPSGPLTATVTAEGAQVQASHFSMTPAALTPIKVAGLAVATLEALETPEGQQTLAVELRESVTLATDTTFLGALTTSAGYSDTLSGDTLFDIATLAGKASLTGFADLVLVVSPTIAVTWPLRPRFLTFAHGWHRVRHDTLVSPACPGLMLIDCHAILTGAIDL